MNTKEQTVIKSLPEEVRKQAKEIFYAGVLHDIGKPFQKIGHFQKSIDETKVILKKKMKENDSDVEGYFQERVDELKDISKSHIRQGIELSKLLFEKKVSLIEDSIRFHHAYNLVRLEKSKDAHDPLIWLIYEADNIASGCDRRDKELGTFPMIRKIVDVEKLKNFEVQIKETFKQCSIQEPKANPKFEEEKIYISWKVESVAYQDGYRKDCEIFIDCKESRLEFKGNNQQDEIFIAKCKRELLKPLIGFLEDHKLPNPDDTDQNEPETIIEEKKQKGSFCKSLPLESIFSSAIKKENDKEYKFEHNLQKDANFVFSELIKFPVIDNKELFNWERVKQAYEFICNDFVEMIKNDKNKDFSNNPSAFLTLLEAYFSYLPSDTHTSREPDISLYQHLKLTSAIALCMYYFLEENKKLNKENVLKHTHWNNKDKHRKENQFLLVSGDISGIQNFIYNVPSEGALKSLRARSFYLEILLEHFVDELLEELGLFKSNLIFLGGGHFYLLLPNTKFVKNKIEIKKRKINEFFLKQFGLKLYLAVAHTECCANDLMSHELCSKLKGKWRDISDKLGKDKLNRYKENLENLFYSEKFAQSHTRECKACKIGFIDNDKGDDLCTSCSELKEHGKKLVKTRVPWLVVQGKGESRAGLLQGNNFTIEIQTPKLKSDEYAYSINQWGTGIEGDYKSTLFLGNYVKGSEDETTLEFEGIANKSIGDKKLGVLRADVDNLGTLFTSGIDDRLISLSRYATLSRSLNMFFKLYLNRICERKELKGLNIPNIPFYFFDNKQNVDKGNFVTIYSGGDDLFIIGAWNEIIELAIDIRGAFQYYTCRKCTLSAGIGVFDHHYPLYLMAEKTASLEKAAKDNGRDSISTFSENLVFKWDEFISLANTLRNTFLSGSGVCKLDLGDKDSKLIYQLPYKSNSEVSKSFIYKLLLFVNTTLKEDKNTTEKPVTLARLHYLIAREKERLNLGSISDKVRRNETENKLNLLFKDVVIESFIGGEHKLKELKTMLSILIMFTRERELFKEEK